MPGLYPHLAGSGVGRIAPGVHRFETPVGVVSVDLRSANEVTIQNVESHVFRHEVEIDVPGLGRWPTTCLAFVPS